MPHEDRVEFQRQILGQILAQKRRPFRRGVALELAFNTTAAAPAQAHTIAKNVLDLMATPDPSLLKTSSLRRRGLLYYDDSQVEALSVSCVHGSGEPSISIVAVPLRDFLEDLAVAALARLDYSDPHESHTDGAIQDALERWLEVRADEAFIRETDGCSSYELIAASFQAAAQRAFLQSSRPTLQALAELYGAPLDPMWARRSRSLAHISKDKRAQLREPADWFFQRSRARVKLAELPHREGTANSYRSHVLGEITAFRDRLCWILDPLRIPVALEVVVKPPRPGPGVRGRHDLDNVVRDYILPRVAELFSPAKLHLQRGAPRDEAGVTQYRAWRLPPNVNDEPGYVSVGFTAAWPRSHCSLYGQIDQAIDLIEWAADYEVA